MNSSVLRESEIEKIFCDRVKSKGGLSYKFVSPQRRGVPDRIVLWPHRVHFIELKTNSGKLTKLQIKQQGILTAMGQRVHTLYGLQDIELYLKDPDQFYLVERRHDDIVPQSFTPVSEGNKLPYCW